MYDPDNDYRFGTGEGSGCIGCLAVFASLITVLVALAIVLSIVQDIF